MSPKEYEEYLGHLDTADRADEEELNFEEINAVIQGQENSLYLGPSYVSGLESIYYLGPELPLSYIVDAIKDYKGWGGRRRMAHYPAREVIRKEPVSAPETIK